MKKIILITLLFQTILLFSQEIYKIDYSYTYRRGYACKSILFTNNKEAVFKIYDEREAGLVQVEEYVAIDIQNDKLSRFFYADNGLAYHRFPYHRREIMYKDSYNQKTNWKINPDKTKKIGQYNCTEAKLTMNGRSFTAWFTFDVPVKFGPLKLHGLPGLIVEVVEDDGYLKIALAGISKTKDLKEFNTYKNYFLKQKTMMTYPEYEKKMINTELSGRISAMNSMKEEYGSNAGLSFEDNVTVEDYLEIPTNFIIEINKYR